MKIDWWNKDDTEDILYIERMTQSNPLSRKDFLALVESENIICKVVKEKDHIVGFFIYEIYKFHVSVYTIVVDPEFRNQGIGTLIIEDLKNHVLKSPQREVIFLQIRESDLKTLNWAKKRGFLAFNINFEAYSMPDEDGIAMRWAGPKKSEQKKGDFHDIRL